MVSPAQRRGAVGWAHEHYRLSQQRACRALVVHRALVRYRSRRRDDTALRARLRELAQDRLTYGQVRLHVLLRREGWPISRKRVHRLYVEEGFQLVPRRRRRRKAASIRQPRPAVTTPNTSWAMGLMQDALAEGSKFRVFTCVDVATRECVALEVAPRFSAEAVVAVLDHAAAQRGQLPQVIRCDNGTEFTGLTLDLWAYTLGIQLDFSRPGRPVDNAVCEAFNANVRRECLTLHWFASLAEAQHVVTQWRDEYNNFRPQRSLGYRTPSGIPRD